MKRNLTPEGQQRFEGQLRHYHRSNRDKQRSWDEWVDGGPSKPKRIQSPVKVIGIVLALLALCGVIVGLFLELR